MLNSYKILVILYAGLIVLLCIGALFLMYYDPPDFSVFLKWWAIVLLSVVGSTAIIIICKELKEK